MRTFMTALARGGRLPSAGRRHAPRRSTCRTSVGEVNDKVDSLGRSVEQTQERTRQNEAKIAEVDTKATAAANSRHSRRTAPAATAQNSANAANNAAKAVDTKLDAFDKASRRLVLEVVVKRELRRL